MLSPVTSSIDLKGAPKISLLIGNTSLALLMISVQVVNWPLLSVIDLNVSNVTFVVDCGNAIYTP